MRLGNPPGKKSTTVGDEINWESLLSAVPDGEDISIVSSDIDFASPLERTRLNSFLAAEWLKRKRGKAFLYTSVSGFFAEHFPGIKVAGEIDKRLTIDLLRNSGSFYATHSVIARLSKLDNFTPADADEIALIAAQNNQVGYIATDPDLQQFFGMLLDNFADQMDPLARRALEDYVYP